MAAAVLQVFSDSVQSLANTLFIQLLILSNIEHVFISDNGNAEICQKRSVPKLQTVDSVPTRH